MLWSSSKQFLDEPFEKEDELEKAVIELARPLFGESRFYLDVKKKIGGSGKIKNIPDGYLLDLSSKLEPKLYIVENELAYQVLPISAITYVAEVKKIERWKDSSKYILYFTEPAKQIGPIKLIPKPNGKVKALQAPRYTSFELLKKAKNLDEAF